MEWVNSDGDYNMQTVKQIVQDIADHLPEQATLEDVMYRLYVLDKIRKSQEAVERGEVISQEELQREISQW